VEPLLKDRLPAARAEWVANGLATAVAVAVTYPLNTLQTRIALLPLAQARYTHIINELANSKGTNEPRAPLLLRFLLTSALILGKGGLLDGLYAGILSVIPGQLAYKAGLHLADKLFLAVIGPTDESQHPTRYSTALIALLVTWKRSLTGRPFYSLPRTGLSCKPV